ncbi:MAG: hemerythrin [Desulfosporosinus sp. BRH_c37]|nr:MAG: hemerythrin [Desulfosporosinus sp. BRH_c37]
MWKDTYKVGVEIIDEQHKELFRRISEFLFSLRNEGHWEDKLPKVKETLEFMQGYVVIHFEDEEEYQKKINYPELMIHKEIHDQFKREMITFSERFNDSDFDEVQVQKFARTLLAWLIKHVAGDDKKIADFIRAQ